MKKLYSIIFLILFFSTSVCYGACPGTPADCYSETPCLYGEAGTCRETVDCSYDAADATVTASGTGDGVYLPACGETTWSSKLTISTIISSLVGAGEGATNIKCGFAASALVAYTAHYNTPFRISSISWNMDSNKYWLIISNADSITAAAEVPNGIRIDHNTLTNTADGNTIQLFGQIYGVMDSNTISPNFHMDVYGDNENSWTHLPAYTTADTFYIEDNTIGTTGNAGSAGWGGRRVFRYNDVTVIDPAHQLLQGLDVHGNQYNSGWSNQMNEVYGNEWDITESRPAGEHSINFVQQRSGSGRIVWNKTLQNAGSGNSYIMLREEYSDETHAPTISPITSQVQHVSDSFYINNRQVGNANDLFSVSLATVDNCCSRASEGWAATTAYSSPDCRIFTGDGGTKCYRVWSSGTSGGSEPTWDKTLARTASDNITTDGTISWLYEGDGTPIVPARDYANYDGGAFDGQSNGVGCGAIGSRPATCEDDTGAALVGYYATDQDCSQVLDANIGVNAATPIAGTLYKCVNDSWVEEWVPYTYPHPLRGEVSGRTGVFADVKGDTSGHVTMGLRSDTSGHLTISID